MTPLVVSSLPLHIWWRHVSCPIYCQTRHFLVQHIMQPWDHVSLWWLLFTKFSSVLERRTRNNIKMRNSVDERERDMILCEGFVNMLSFRPMGLTFTEESDHIPGLAQFILFCAYFLHLPYLFWLICYFLFLVWTNFFCPLLPFYEHPIFFRYIHNWQGCNMY